MFEWKNLELSPEDYENYVNNEDQAQMRVNNANISELQWSKLYQKIQSKSQNNKKMKKYILAYENNLKRLISHINGDIPAKELSIFYGKHSNELKMQLTQLYEQLGLLHIRNLSTTVEFIISRLLNIQEELIRIVSIKQSQIDDLLQAKNALQLGKSSQLCTSCYQEMEKNRNKFLIKQIMTVNQSSEELETIAAQELTDPEKQERKLKEESKKQEHQYEVQRFYYLNSVEEVLRNREKILKCNSAPLQTLLSQYLTQILEMLQGSKFSFTPKNLREYDRINKSYESLEDMKSLINSDQFYKKVTILIEKPYQNLVENIEKHISKSTVNKSVGKKTVQTQTLYLTEFNQIKILEKKVGELSNELQTLKHSKNRNEIDLIDNLQALHKIEIRYMQIANRNKILQAENKKLQNHISELKNQITTLEENHRSDQSMMIDTNVHEKSGFIKEIRNLQAKVKKYESLNLMRSEKEIQTDEINSEQTFEKELIENVDKEYKKLIDRRQQKKERKRASHRLEETKLIKQNQTNKFQFQRQEGHDIGRSKQNSLLDINDTQRSNDRSKTIKIYTISPLSPLNDKLIHRSSSRKISSIKIKEDMPLNDIPSLIRISSPRNEMKKMKRINQSKMKHFYHNSQLSNKNSKHTKQDSNLSKLSVLTGKKILRQNSIKINESKDRSQLQSLINIRSKDELNSQIQFLNIQDQKYLVKINQPHSQFKVVKPKKDLLSDLMSSLEPEVYSQKKEELSKLMHFSLKNFDALLEKNIFGMICDMKFDKNGRVSTRKEQKNKDSLQIKESPETEPTIEVECSKIGRKCLEIFFNMQQAEKYEKKEGIWGQIDTFIMVDNNFTNLSEKIQYFFEDLKDLKPMLYQQSILFLQKPYYFCQEVEGKDYETKQITIFRESLKCFQLQRNWIKNLFKKLLRLHKLIHKNCHHIHKFLEIIGFQKE